MNYKYFITGLIIGLIIGGLIGVNMAIEIMINKLVKIVPVFTNISIDEIAIREAILKYNNNINSCIS